MITVIIADDHKILTDGIRVLLEKEPDIRLEGYASTGKQALALIQHQPVDVAVLDIGMPDMDGFKTAEAIMAHATRTQIVILTGFDNPDYIRRMRALGVKGYILKEQGQEELVAAIRAVYKGEEYWGKGIAQKVMDAYFPAKTTQEPKLTPREQDVLSKICTCGTSAEIGHLLRLKESTVQTHIRHMLSKLNLRNKQTLLLYALENGYCTSSKTPKT